MSLYKIAALCVIFLAVLAILIVGKDFLIPLVIAIGIWFFFNAIAHWYGKIKLNGKSAPIAVRYILTTITIFLFFYLLTQLISSNVDDLQAKLPVYNSNINNLENSILEALNIEKRPSFIPDFLSTLNLQDLLKPILNAISAVFSNAFLIVIYLIFLLLEQRMFGKKLRKIFADKYQGKLNSTINTIKKSIENYILLKTVVSILTGILSFIVLKLIGVDFAFFWAFLIFLLNFIPNIGSLIATIFPVLLTFIQFKEPLLPALLVLVCISSIQMLVGNFLEPRIFGKSLNISSLMVILSLTFWGMVWGVTGMFLCVPITVIIMIILNNFKETRPIAIMISDDGDI